MSWKINRTVMTITAVVLLMFSLALIGANRAAFRNMTFAQDEYNECVSAYGAVHRVALSYQEYLLEHGALVEPDELESVNVYGPLPVRTVGLTEWKGKRLIMRDTSARARAVAIHKQIEAYRGGSNVDQ